MFREGDFVVYPSHGVGKLISIENQSFEGISVELLVISFDRDRMILRLPRLKAEKVGLRPLSSRTAMEEALDVLKLKPKVRRTMWSRRAQEYETKINSGNPLSIAEVIRDLYRNTEKPDQSYSERQIYQMAVERFVRELAAVEQIDEAAAVAKLETVLRAA